MMKIEKKLILVVDDSPDNIDLLSSLLGDVYKIKAATNGERALKIVNTEPYPDLVLLDVMMPVMDGYELCRTIKNNDKLKHIPVIFVTARTDAHDEKLGFESGAADYITKPIKPEIVKVRVRTHIELSVARKELEQSANENKEMLDQTLVGAMRVVSDLLSWANPAAFLRAARLRAFMVGMVDALQIQDGWQLNLAASLSQIGMVAIPMDEMRKYSTGQGVSVKFLNLFKRQGEIGGRALEQVPRLSLVANLIANQFQPLPAPGEYPAEITKRDFYLLGRQILKIIIDFDHFLLGEKSSGAIKKMLKDPHYDRPLVETLNGVIQQMSWIPCALPPNKLLPGMVMDEHIMLSSRPNDKMMKGTVLTPAKVGELILALDREGQRRLVRVNVPFKVDKDGNLPSIHEMQEPFLMNKPVQSVSPIDLKIVEPLLIDIYEYIQDDSPLAKQGVAKLLVAVSGTGAEDLGRKIQQKVDMYEFPEALQLVRELATSVRAKID
ncbi:MAG: response regulator [Magnetococcales bacterium]|nr:response regulator [Magnetococcales bacterium]